MNLDETASGLPALPPEVLVRTFPFLLQWDGDLRLRAVGPSLAKALPALAPGALLGDLFRLRRPVGQLSPDFFTERINPDPPRER